jgi:simple sugar transport system permease protein
MKDSSSADKQLRFLICGNGLVLLAATLYSHGQFVGADNLQSMASQLPELGLLAMGVAIAMIAGSGGIDLSVVAIANLSGIVAGKAANQLLSINVDPLQQTLIFTAVALITGLMCGLANGALIAFARLTPILATLGTQLVFTGVAVVLTNGSALRLTPTDELAYPGNGLIFDIPVAFLLFVTVLLVIGGLLKNSRYGLQLFLVGTNQKAADYAGIPCAKVLITTYAISGLLSATAGILIASRTSSVKWDYGNSYLLIAILIAVMAGVKPEGGYGRMICLFFSTTALQAVSSSFNLFEISNFFRDCIWGFMLILFLFTSTGTISRVFPKKSI